MIRKLLNALGDWMCRRGLHRMYKSAAGSWYCRRLKCRVVRP